MLVCLKNCIASASKVELKSYLKFNIRVNVDVIFQHFNDFGLRFG